MSEPLPGALESRDLRLLRCIVDCGGLARAAERLHATPSALSHRLAELERRLGMRLFARVGRRLVPTPAGEALHAGAAPLLQVLADLEVAARRTTARHDAVVRLATECTTCYHWLPQALQLFEKEQPRVEVRIVLAATRRTMAALLDGEIDVAISDRSAGAARLVARPLFTSDLVTVVAAGHRLAGRRFLRAADFAGERLLRYAIPRQSSTLLRDILEPAGVELEADETVELTEAIVELVRAGRGIAVLPEWIAAPWTQRGELVAVPIREPAARRRWAAWTRRRADPHALALVAALRRLQLPGTRTRAATTGNGATRPSPAARAGRRPG